MKKPELLAPAGTLEKLKFAITYGADAVYLGGPMWGLRAYAGNFSMDDIAAGVAFAHGRGAKVYVTVNMIPHNEDLEGLEEYLLDLAALNIDAFIISDPGILAVARAVAPQIDCHLSTQANVVNWRSARFWVEQGISRLILARELSWQEIKEIGQKVKAELEVFVHGAMCVSYSGRCLLSNYLTGRDANRGACAQPCRYQYYLVESKRPGQYFPVAEDGRGAYIMNSKDLCLIEHLPLLLELPLAGLKIEGRMKSAHYVATVTKVYRQAIDAYYDDPEAYCFQPHWLEELTKVSNRSFTTGFFLDKPGPDAQVYKGELYERPYEFVGIVLGYDDDRRRILVEQRNNFQAGDHLEVLTPRGENSILPVKTLFDAQGQTLDAARHPQMQVAISYPQPLPAMSLLRRSNSACSQERRNNNGV